MTTLRNLVATAAVAATLAGCPPPDQESPDLSGEWGITYDDTLSVKIKIGGAVHTAEIGTEGGSVTIEHDGKPITFDLDCEKEEVVCPSEVWPTRVTIRHEDPDRPRNFWVHGEDQPEDTRDAFGIVNEAGDHFTLLLGGGATSNGVNCVLLGLSAAEGDLVTSQVADGDDWRAEEITDGRVVTGYAGGCLWAKDVDADGDLEAAILGASVELRTGFVGARR